MELRESKSDQAKKVTLMGVKKILHVEQIFQGRNKITLRHAGENYTLQITKNNKLLLTK